MWGDGSRINHITSHRRRGETSRASSQGVLTLTRDKVGSTIRIESFLARHLGLVFNSLQTDLNFKFSPGSAEVYYSRVLEDYRSTIEDYHLSI